MKYSYTTFDDLFNEHGIKIEDAPSGVRVSNDTFIEALPVNFLHLKNAIIHPWSHGIFTEDKWVFDTVSRIATKWPLRSDLNYSEIPEFNFSADEKTITTNFDFKNNCNNLKGNYFFIDTNHSENFSHTTQDIAPASMIFNHIRQSIPDLTPVFHKKFKYKNQKDLFSMLFIDYDSCFFIETTENLTYKFENLYVPHVQGNWGAGTLDDNFERYFYFNIAGSLYAKNKIKSLLNLNSPTLIKNLYLYRKNELANSVHFQTFGIDRSFKNLTQLNEMLLENNFLAVDPASLNVHDLGFLLDKAENIISIHGAGLANIIFTNNNPKIVEIKPSAFNDESSQFYKGGVGFEYMSKCWGYDQYKVVFGEINSLGEQMINLAQVSELLNL